MKVDIKDERTVHLRDVPEDEMLVVYEGRLCVRDGRYSLFTVWGEIIDNISSTTEVNRIKYITVELV